MAIDYQLLIDKAMLNIVREILLDAQDNGLNGDQAFYISFRTDDAGVILSEHVRQLYPNEITIVLQYQYKNLQVLTDRFSVNLSFNNIPETLEVPFSALTGFADPSVNFNLQFKNYDTSIEVEDKKMAELATMTPKAKPALKSTAKKAGEVIAIDKFRKKEK